MFQVTTLDLNKVAETGKVDYDKDFFGKMASLTVSGQLEAETFAMAYKKVYTFGPTFRAENSNTKTHASEFWMIEPEIAFCDLNMDMDIMEDMLKYVVKYVLDNCPDYLLGREVPVWDDANRSYVGSVSYDDVSFITELRHYPGLYNKIMKDVRRSASIINKKFN